MTDFVTKITPIPVPRPIIDDPTRVDPSIAIRMPLGSTEKAADAFSEVPRYPPTGEGVKSLYGLLKGSVEHFWRNIMNPSDYTPGDWVFAIGTTGLCVTLAAVVIVGLIKFYIWIMPK